MYKAQGFRNLTESSSSSKSSDFLSSAKALFLDVPTTLKMRHEKYSTRAGREACRGQQQTCTRCGDSVNAVREKLTRQQTLTEVRRGTQRNGKSACMPKCSVAPLFDSDMNYRSKHMRSGDYRSSHHHAPNQARALFILWEGEDRSLHSTC